MKKMKSIRILAVLLTAVFAVGVTGTAMSAAVIAAEPDAEEVTSTFTFTNQGVDESEPDNGNPDGNTGNTGGTGNTGTTAAGTGDVGTAPYTAATAAAGACIAVFLGVAISRRRRYGKAGR